MSITEMTYRQEAGQKSSKSCRGQEPGAGKEVNDQMMDTADELRLIYCEYGKEIMPWGIGILRKGVLGMR